MERGRCCTEATNQVHSASFPNFNASLNAVSVESKIFTLQGQAWQIIITPTYESFSPAHQSEMKKKKKKYVSVYLAMIPAFISLRDCRSNKAHKSASGGGGGEGCTFRFWLACLHKNDPELTYVLTDIFAFDSFYSDMGYSCYMPHDILSDYLVGANETLCIQVVVEKVPSLVTCNVHVILESELLSLNSPQPRAWPNILQKGMDSNQVPYHKFVFGRFDNVRMLRKKMASSFNICPKKMQLWRINNNASVMKAMSTSGKKVNNNRTTRCKWPCHVASSEMTLLDSAHENLHGMWSHLRWKLLHTSSIDHQPIVMLLRTTHMDEMVTNKYLLRISPNIKPKDELQTHSLRCKCADHGTEEHEYDSALVLCKYLDLGRNEGSADEAPLVYLGSFDIPVDLSIRRMKMMLESQIRSHRQAVEAPFVSGSWRCVERISLFLEPSAAEEEAGAPHEHDDMKELDESDTLRDLNIGCGTTVVVVTHPYRTDALVATELRMLYQQYPRLYGSPKVPLAVREWSMCGSHHKDILYFQHVSTEHLQLVSARKEVDRARDKFPVCICCADGVRRSMNLKCLAKREQTVKMLEKSYDSVKELYGNMKYALSFMREDNSSGSCEDGEGVHNEEDELDRIAQEIVTMGVKKTKKRRNRKRAEKHKKCESSVIEHIDMRVVDADEQICTDASIVSCPAAPDVGEDMTDVDALSLNSQGVTLTDKMDEIDGKLDDVQRQQQQPQQQYTMPTCDDGFTEVVFSRKRREKKKNNTVEKQNVSRGRKTITSDKHSRRNKPDAHPRVRKTTSDENTNTKKPIIARETNETMQHSKDDDEEAHFELVPDPYQTNKVLHETRASMSACLNVTESSSPDLNSLWDYRYYYNDSSSAAIGSVCSNMSTAGMNKKLDENTILVCSSGSASVQCSMNNQSDVSGPSSLVSERDPVFVPRVMTVQASSPAVNFHSRHIHLPTSTLFGLASCFPLTA